MKNKSMKQSSNWVYVGERTGNNDQVFYCESIFIIKELILIHCIDYLITMNQKGSQIKDMIEKCWKKNFGLSSPPNKTFSHDITKIESTQSIPKFEKHERKKIWERLIKDKREFYEENRLKKIQKEIKQDVKTNLTKKCKSCSVSNITQRLYRQGLQINKVKYKLYQQARSRVEYFPFKPQVSKQAQILKTRQKPIYQRLEEVISQRLDEIIRLKLNRQEEENNKFMPTIDKKSEEICQMNKSNCKNVVDRLMEAAKKTLQNKLKIIQQRQEEMNQYTFIPEINCNQLFGNFRNSIQNFEFVAKIDNEQEKLFQPKLNQMSQYLVQTNNQRVEETMKDKVTRLSHDHYKKKERLKKLQEEFYKQYKFVPKIDPISKTIGKKKNILQLSTSRNREIKLTRIREELQLNQMKECYFHPQINQKSKNMIRDDSVQQLKISRKLQSVKQQLQFEELRECKFHPQINKNVNIKCMLVQLVESNLHQIKGIENYLSNVQNMRKKIQSQKMKENEIFNLEKKYNAKPNRQKKTSIQPFNLSKGNQNSIENLRHQLLQEQRRLCPFQPNIISNQ